MGLVPAGGAGEGKLREGKSAFVRMVAVSLGPKGRLQVGMGGRCITGQRPGLQPVCSCEMWAERRKALEQAISGVGEHLEEKAGMGAAGPRTRLSHGSSRGLVSPAAGMAWEPQPHLQSLSWPFSGPLASLCCSPGAFSALGAPRPGWHNSWGRQRGSPRPATHTKPPCGCERAAGPPARDAAPTTRPCCDGGRRRSLRGTPSEELTCANGQESHPCLYSAPSGDTPCLCPGRPENRQDATPHVNMPLPWLPLFMVSGGCVFLPVHPLLCPPIHAPGQPCREHLLCSECTLGLCVAGSRALGGWPAALCCDKCHGGREQTTRGKWQWGPDLVSGGGTREGETSPDARKPDGRRTDTERGTHLLLPHTFIRHLLGTTRGDRGWRMSQCARRPSHHPVGSEQASHEGAGRGLQTLKAEVGWACSRRWGDTGGRSGRTTDGVFASVPSGRHGPEERGGASVREQQTMSLGRPFRLPTPCLLTTQPVGAALLRAFRKASAQPSESSTTGLGGALRKGPSWSLPTGLYLPPLPAEPHGGPRADTRSPLCTPRRHAITHPPPPGKHAPRTLPPPARFPPGSKAAAFTLEKGPLNVAGQGLAASSGHVEKPRLCPASCTTPASTLHF